MPTASKISQLSQRLSPAGFWPVIGMKQRKTPIPSPMLAKKAPCSLLFAASIFFSAGRQFPLLQPCVVVKFYPWFKFYFLLLLGMVMYDHNNMITGLKQKKRKFKPRIKLNDYIYTEVFIKRELFVHTNMITNQNTSENNWGCCNVLGHHKEREMMRSKREVPINYKSQEWDLGQRSLLL